MKTFVYTIENVGRPRYGYQDKRVTVYRVTRNDVTQVASETYNCKSDGQAARELAAEKKLFRPGKPHEFGGMRTRYENGFEVCGDARFKKL